ncbi:MAG: phytochelatin synthase family protein [Rickettsiales bacterium]|nr:phytochelatin synthase family protein [Rickettsiales bacterium]
MKFLIKITFNNFICAFSLLVFSFFNFAYGDDNINFYSDKGLQMLNQSQFKNDFYQLVNFYQPQINPLYCSVATAVILLNATHQNGKISIQKANKITSSSNLISVDNFHFYSQLNFLNDKTDKIKKREIINLQAAAGIKNGEEFFDAGLSLNDFSKILTQVYDFKVQKNHVENNNQKSLQKFRQDLKKYLSDSKNFIVVNFDGRIVENGTKGHFSPLAAYDEVADSVLVLDVALHKTTWYWVDLEKLFQAMNTKDGNYYRGYLVISFSNRASKN